MYSLRDAYERLYRYESNRREENVPWREHLNTCYDEFVMRYGNLNAKQNVKLVMMDAGGRDILSLERAEDGKFVKADIFVKCTPNIGRISICLDGMSSVLYRAHVV